MNAINWHWWEKKQIVKSLFVDVRKRNVLTDSYQQFFFYEIDTMLRPFFNVLLFVRIFFTWETINYYRSCVYSHLTLRHKAIAIKIIDNCITIIIVIAYLIHAYFFAKEFFFFLHLDMRSIKTLKFLCCVKMLESIWQNLFFNFGQCRLYLIFLESILWTIFGQLVVLILSFCL